ncbi:SKP1-like protein 1A [Zea mays]|uniref:SKP1-like protein 1A n=1 Tax=Zea mays TaxID=4577 RepID=A0A3L6D9Y4_MAIZE|nr:SKP1-like protein 1A [Zea mays]
MAVAEKVKEKMLMLRSSDNQEFEVKESVAMQSMTLKKMIEDGCADKGIPLPNVTSHILVKVIEYCNKHAEPTGPGDAAGTTNRSAEDELKIFDADFVNVEHSTLLDLILAANYLDIKGLLNLARQTITDLINGKMPEEVCKTNIRNDLTIPSTSALATTMPSSERKQMEARFIAYMQETAEERMTGFAVRGEKYRKHGERPPQPPLEIVKYPALLERAWGWDSILPYCPVNSWPLYKTYLQEYYERNSREVLAHQVEANAASGPNLNGADENDLATLFNLITFVEYTGFPFPSVALKFINSVVPIANHGFKCIMAESDLLRKLLMCGTGMISQVNICSRIRKVAFRFMTYKGPGCFAAAATMMATTKEAKLMSGLLRNRCRENNGPFYRSVFIRKWTFAAMFRICEECSPVEESTGGYTATKLILDGSDDNNPCDKDLLQRNKINQKYQGLFKGKTTKCRHPVQKQEPGDGGLFEGECSRTSQHEVNGS